jgi:hypothetical protein
MAPRYRTGRVTQLFYCAVQHKNYATSCNLRKNSYFLDALPEEYMNEIATR